jgi:hypothetical protein
MILPRAHAHHQLSLSLSPSPSSLSTSQVLRAYHVLCATFIAEIVIKAKLDKDSILEEN